MKIIKDKISLEKLKEMAEKMYGNLFGNRTRGVDNPEIKEKIRKIVNKLVTR